MYFMYSYNSCYNTKMVSCYVQHPVNFCIYVIPEQMQLESTTFPIGCFIENSPKVIVTAIQVM